MKIIIFFIFYFCSVVVQGAIRIKELKVPESIESGSVDDVILDCDFEADGERGIEVKWFLNGQVEQIYQWIPETNKPGQAVGRLKDNIDVNYKITNDKNTMHRALHIINITPEMSGNYTCKVSSYQSEDVHTKGMIIYEPADSGLDLAIVEEESVILCAASGIYPQPNMTLYIANDNGSEIFYIEDDETLELDDTGLYNVSSTLYFNPDNLTSPFEYVCELSIPGTSYHLRKLKIHYLEIDDIELINEGDYVNLVNITNSTESPVWIYKESAEYETQIEGDIDITNTTELAEDTENNSSEENSSIYHLSSVYLLSTIITLLLFLNNEI